MIFSGRNQTLKYLILLLLIALPLFSLGLTNHGLWSADEPRVAEIGREMAITGNWIVPALNQRPFLEEPPLYYGVLALTFKIFGTSDRVVRIPSALFGIGGAIVTFFIGNLLFGPGVALLSALILTTGGEYFRVAHTVIVDSALTFFVICTMGLFAAGYLTESTRRKLFYYVLSYVFASLAFYTKGFIGIVIPGLAILSFLVADKNLKEIFKMQLWLGVIIFFVMTLPWFIGLWQQGGVEHLKVFLVHNHLQRFFPASLAGSLSGEASGHHHPFYYYLVEFPAGFLPWSLLLVPTFIYAFSKVKKPDIPSGKGLLFVKCWFIAGFIFLSVASTKRTLYLMPILAPASMLVALFINSTLKSQSLDRIGKVFLWVFAATMFIIGTGFVPGFIYARARYALNTSKGLWILVVAFSLFIAISSIMAIRYLWHGNLKRYWITATIPVFAGLTFAAAFFAPLADQHKSFVPFSRQVMAIVPSQEPLYAYSPDETLRGAVPFYTGRYLTEIHGLKEMEQIVETKGNLFVIIRDKRNKTENELLSTGKFSIVFQKAMGVDRSLTLFSNNPPRAFTMVTPPEGSGRKAKSP